MSSLLKLLQSSAICPPLGEGRVLLSESIFLKWIAKEKSSMVTAQCGRLTPESIEWFLEGQAVSWSSDLAPRPPLSPPPMSVSSTGDTQEDWERETSCWRKRGKGGGRADESYDRKQAWSPIIHSILSGWRAKLWSFPHIKKTQSGERELKHLHSETVFLNF